MAVAAVSPASPTNPNATVTKAAKKAKKKKAADPDRPKKPMSAWLLFLGDFRKENSNLKHTEVMKVAAAKWKTLSAAERSRWEQPAQRLREEYATKYDVYVKSGKKAAWDRDPERPKRPLTGFLRFSMDVRAKQLPGVKVTELTKQASAEWSKMSEQQKSPYEAAYKAEKETYDKAMAAYKAAGKDEAWKLKVGLAKPPKEEPAKTKATKKATAAAAAPKAKAATAAKKASSKGSKGANALKQ